MEKTLRRDANTARWRSKVEPNIHPAAGPFLGAWDGQLEMATTFTNTPSLAMIDARSFELSW